MRNSIGTMKSNYRWMSIVLLILVKYAATTSIAEEINSQITNSRERPTVAEYQRSPTVRLYDEALDANDQEDSIDDTDWSASEVIEVHALPETVDSDDSRGGDDSGTRFGSGVGVQRARRRRRRRRRKRPKTATAAVNVPVVASVSATSVDSTTPTAAAAVKPSEDGLNLYYTLPEDEIRKKPFKYRPSADNVGDTLVPQSAAFGDDDDGYTRRRAAKRRRRPLKKPPPVDYHPSYTLDDDDDATGQADSDNDNRQSWVQPELKPTPKASHSIKPATTTTTFTSTSASTTTTTTTNAPLPPSKQDDLYPSEVAIDGASQEDADNTWKKRKRPMAVVHQKTQQHQHRNETKDARYESAHQHQQKPVEQNVVAKVESDHRSKLVDNRKELFKMRRLPPTWAILGHSKHRTFSSLSTATKNETTPDKNANNNEDASQIQDGALNETVAEVDDDDTRSSVSATSSTMPTVIRHRQHVSYENEGDSTHSKNNRTRETDDVSATFKTIAPTSEPKFKSTPASLDTEETASSNKLTLAAGDDEDSDHSTDDARQQQKPEQNRDQETEIDTAGLPLIAYTGQTRPIVSNASVVSNANDQRLAIIYVPCNQTADKILSNGGAGVLPQPTKQPADASSVKTTRKVNGPETTTARKPDTAGQIARVDESASSAIGSQQKPKSEWSSTVRPTTSLWSPSPPSLPTSSFVTSNIAEKAPPVGVVEESNSNSIVVSPSPATNTNREAKRYLDATATKVKSESAKEEQGSPSLRKPYSSSGFPNAAFVKPFAGSSREIVISYTSSTNSPPSLFQYHNIDSADEQMSLQLNNNSGGTLLHRKTFDGNTLINRRQQQQQQQQQHVERKKLPLAVKSAIIISGAILALAVLGFFALLLSCKIRQAKSRMKCHRQLYRDQFQSNEFRQSSRSTSPVMSKSNFNTRNFTNNNVQSANVTASNRNYYLWQTLRKTFQYD